MKKEDYIRLEKTNTRITRRKRELHDIASSIAVAIGAFYFTVRLLLFLMGEYSATTILMITFTLVTVVLLASLTTALIINMVHSISFEKED
jgi:hypothetical protein